MRTKQKVLIWAWLVLSAIIIIPYQAKATQDFWTISIANPDNPNEWFTIMDRNLWATEVWTWKEAPYNSYWNCYQRWNNYWFPCKWEITNISKERIDASWYWPNNPYSNPRFIDDNFYRDERNNHNLWWWKDDKENKWWYPIENLEERQWPCPEWYHVPSAWEWSKALEFWCNSNPKKCEIKSNEWLNYTNMDFDIWLSFANDLKIPFAWYRWTTNATSFEWRSITLRTSSPSNSTYEWYSNCLQLTERIDDMGVTTSQHMYRSKALPIRCFKNTYTPETSKDTITKCEWMENAKVSHNINDDVITLKWNAIEWSNVEISVYDQENKKYKNIWNVKMSDWKFNYKAKREGEHKFKLSNGCDDFYYEIDWKQIFLEDNTNMDWQLNEINSMSFWTISIANPDNPSEWFTIMDRNLWASTNDINNINSYGYKYQWGNNYWFEDGCTPTDWNNCSDSVANKATYVWVIRNDKYNNNWYFNKKFIKWSNYRDGAQDHNWLRWWENDSYSNNWGLDIISKTVNKRQWPCPKGYHVPSAWEWEKLAEYWWKQNNFPKISSVRWWWVFADYDPYNDKPKNEFQKYFKLPSAGYRYYEDGEIWKYEDGYRSSSPTSPTEAKVIMLSPHTVWESEQYKTFWYSIRCFKDTYNSTSQKDIEEKIIKNEEKTTENKKNETTTQTEIDTIKKTDYNSLNPSEILWNWYTREMNNAYEFSRENWITTTNNIEKAKMNSPLTRIAMAKMLSYYAINVLWQKPDSSKVIQFNDVTNQLNSQYNNAVTLSYQLWTMWQNMKNNNFRPNDEVTRAEFATALSRMLYDTEDGKWKIKYYEPHITKLYSEWVLSNTNPQLKEKRWYVMLMLMRSVK